MHWWDKPKPPIDRAVQDLDREIVRLQREIRRLSDSPLPAERADQRLPNPARSPLQSIETFLRSMLAPPRRTSASEERARRDLFDLTDDPLKELDTEPVVFAGKSRPDLFSASATAAARDSGPKPGVVIPFGKSAAGGTRLAEYLSAGSPKAYKPLKHVQRQERKRFFMWIGLAFAVLWLIYVVIR